MNFNPIMAINGRPFNSLLRFLSVIRIDFLKEFIKIIFYHLVEGEWLRLPLLPGVDVDSAHH